MNFIRKLASLATVLSLLMSVGCAAGTEDDDGTLSIVCTIFPQYDFARSIAGDVSDVNIKMLLGPGQESHDFDPSSKDIAAVHDCDIFVYVGGESDSWIRDMLDSVDTENKTVISLMDVVEPAEEETVEGMETDKHDHDSASGAIDHVEYDEHVWTSPKNALKITEAIADAMCRHMPESADTFRANCKKYSEQINSVDESFETLVRSVESPMMIVCDRFPLLYFCKDYGIEYYAAFSGCAASTESSSKTVQFLIEKVKSEGIPAVFKMDMSTGNIANTVAEATDTKVLTFYSCHTVSTDDFTNGETYVSLMQKNIAALSESFGVMQSK